MRERWPAPSGGLQWWGRVRRVGACVLACALAGSLLGACTETIPPSPWAEEGMHAEPRPYVLRPGDRVEVRPVLDSQYGVVAVIAPDGTVAVPGVGRVEAAGKTLPEVAELVSARYEAANVLRNPVFTANLLDVAEKEVFVGGEVGRPGLVAVGGGPRSVMQAIMARGGPLVTGRLNDVVILRVQPDGGVRLITTDLTRVLSGEDLAQNVSLHPMDVVIVPKSRIAQIDTAIDQYIRRASPLPPSFLLLFTNSPTGVIP